jgi:phage baseplate assembly protein W
MSSDSRQLLGSDLLLTEYQLGADLFVEDGDFGIASEDMNLAQAILHRLRTVKGELADLGHPNYGSTIFEFVGQPNNQTTRMRLQLAIRDTLLQEPRIKEIVSIVARPQQAKDANMVSIQGASGATTRVRLGKFAEGQQEVAYNTEGGEKYADTEFILSPIDALNSVEVLISVIPIDRTVPLNIVFPFYLEGAGSI